MDEIVRNKPEFVERLVEKLSEGHNYDLIGGYNGKPVHSSPNSHIAGIDFKLFFTQDNSQNNPLLLGSFVFDQGPVRRYAQDFLYNAIYTLATEAVAANERMEGKPVYSIHGNSANNKVLLYSDAVATISSEALNKSYKMSVPQKPFIKKRSLSEIIKSFFRRR